MYRHKFVISLAILALSFAQLSVALHYAYHIHSEEIHVSHDIHDHEHHHDDHDHEDHPSSHDHSCTECALVEIASTGFVKPVNFLPLNQVQDFERVSLSLKHILPLNNLYIRGPPIFLSI